MTNRAITFRHYTLIALCSLILLLILQGPIIAHATTYYVSLSGNDSYPGTQSQPFRTFKKAISPLVPGDTLYIRGGLWTEQIDLMTPNKSGTSGNYLKIAGYPGETVTIRYADPYVNSYGPIKSRGTRGYLIFENLVLDGSNTTEKTNWQIRQGNHHFILRNIEIKNFRSTGLFIQANDIQVINCSIHDQITVGTYRHYGIYFNGANGLIQGSKIYNNPGGGIHAYPGPISNLIIRGNTVYNNSTKPDTTVGGILVYGSPSYPIANTQIYNNLVYRNSPSPSGSTGGILVGPYTSGTKVWNNTIYGNKGNGLQIGFTASSATTKSTVAQNNISYGNGNANYLNAGTSTFSTSNITTDPKFVNAASNNFQLQSGSPAANKGVVLSSVKIDYRNIPRPKGTTYDIGGYENY